MKTNKDIIYQGSNFRLKYLIPKGSKVEVIPNESNFYWVDPNTFPRISFEYHDATYYGLRVKKEDVDFS